MNGMVWCFSINRVDGITVAIKLNSERDPFLNLLKIATHFVKFIIELVALWVGSYRDIFMLIFSVDSLGFTAEQ